MICTTTDSREASCFYALSCRAELCYLDAILDEIDEVPFLCPRCRADHCDRPRLRSSSESFLCPRCYRLVKRFEMSQHTIYQLFVRERGLRSEYVELLLSQDAGDVAKVLEVTGGELLQTRLAKLTRF